MSTPNITGDGVVSTIIAKGERKLDMAVFEDGVSHNPKENAAPFYLAAGARVLLGSLIGLDQRLA